MHFRRSTKILVATVAASLMASGVALADSISVDGSVDGDIVSPPSGVNVCSSGSLTSDGLITVKWNNSNGQQHYVPGHVLDVTAVVRQGGSEVTDGSVTSETTALAPISWPAGHDPWQDGDSFTIPISTVVDANAPSGAYQVTYTVAQTGIFSDEAAPFIVHVRDDECGTPLPPANVAPVINSFTGDAAVNEGPGSHTYTVTATDADGDPLTYAWTVLSGRASITGSGASVGVVFPDGPDNVSLQVTVSDDHGHSVTDTKAISVANVAPSVTGVTASATSACAVSVSAPFGDPGDDTWRSLITWGDGASTPADPTTNPVTGVHTYGSAGTFAIGVTVTDSDNDASAPAGTSFATKNIPSSFLQPINAAGTRSVFKLGSTIPVKITVSDCGGNSVSTLIPTVNLVMLDKSPDGSVNEMGVDAVATNGKSMRWDGTQYIYNLSTKNSQFNGGAALTAGTYKLTVNDPSFFGVTSTTIDLR